MQKDKILVVGGSGFYGSYLVNDLIRHTEADIIVVGRTHKNTKWINPTRVQFIQCDIRDIKKLEEIVKDAKIIIHCAGPFQDLPLTPLQAAINKGVDYIDISEDRKYTIEVGKLRDAIAESGITVLNGMSVAPAMEIVFANLIKDCFDSLTSARTFAAPDTKKHRGPAMFHGMLLGVGRAFLQPKDGILRKVWGWTEPEWVDFPPPIGKRLTYLVLEMADLDLMPQIFDIKTVEFKAGTEWASLNFSLGIAASIRKLFGFPNWEKFAPMVRALSWLLGRFGKDEGGAVFEFQGMRKNLFITHKLAIMAKKDGGIIPSVLASISAKKLLSGEIQMKGIVPLNEWISNNELIKALAYRNLEIWWKPFDVNTWQLFELSDFQRYCKN